ncbi:Yip1-domain-containing protein [Atractiella rhizophila]|nr:Yip1-domain-containing protein [Atractiella rhizophila]
MASTNGYSIPVPETAISIEPDDDEPATAVPPKSQSQGGGGPGKGKERENLLSGNIGSSPSGGGTGGKNMRQNIGGIQTETRYTGMDTLDEPVSETFMRDARAISAKIVQVLRPTSHNAVLRDWDLWGPLIFCLALAVLLSMNASGEQSLSIFTGVFVIVWVGSVVVTINAKLLGGKVSFFQSLCVLGYCVFPLDLAALLSLFVKTIFIRAPVSLAAFAWAIYAAVNFLGGTQLKDGRGGDWSVLAVYPLFLLYFVLAWMTMLS